MNWIKVDLGRNKGKKNSKGLEFTSDRVAKGEVLATAEPHTVKRFSRRVGRIPGLT